VFHLLILQRQLFGEQDVHVVGQVVRHMNLYFIITTHFWLISLGDNWKYQMKSQNLSWLASKVMMALMLQTVRDQHLGSSGAEWGKTFKKLKNTYLGSLFFTFSGEYWGVTSLPDDFLLEFVLALFLIDKSASACLISSSTSPLSRSPDS